MTAPNTLALPRHHPHPPRRAARPAVSHITLVPSWRVRLLRAWKALWRNGSQGAAAPSPEDAAHIAMSELAELPAHLLCDIGVSEGLRAQARLERDLQRQRLLEFEHGHRTFFDGRW